MDFDPRKNVLQGILKGAKAGMADGLKQKYRSPAPNLEASAVQPVPGAEGEDAVDAQPEPEPQGDELTSILEQLVNAKPQ